MSGKFPFAIIIDGTTVLPHAMRRELDLRTLPLHVSCGAESSTAAADLPAEQFYEKVQDPKPPPPPPPPPTRQSRARSGAAGRA